MRIFAKILLVCVASVQSVVAHEWSGHRTVVPVARSDKQNNNILLSILVKRTRSSIYYEIHTYQNSMVMMMMIIILIKFVKCRILAILLYYCLWMVILYIKHYTRMRMHIVVFHKNNVLFKQRSNIGIISDNLTWFSCSQTHKHTRERKKLGSQLSFSNIIAISYDYIIYLWMKFYLPKCTAKKQILSRIRRDVQTRNYVMPKMTI